MISVRAALHAEWTKVRTAPGMVWLVLAVILLTTGASAAAVATVNCPSVGCTIDPTKTSLTGVTLGQAVVAVLAVVAIGGEYTTGMIRTTLTAIPGRATVLAAKTAILAAIVLGAGTAGVLGSLLAGRLVTPGHGLPPLSLADGSVQRAAIGSTLYLGLIALLSLGVATVVRDSATAAGIALGLLYLPPIIAQALSDPQWRRHLGQIAPMTAGQAVQATRDLGSLPIGPWAGLGVLAAWAGGALLLGGLALRQRDA